MPTSIQKRPAGRISAIDVEVFYSVKSQFPTDRPEVSPMDREPNEQPLDNEELEIHIRRLCQSKADEFKILGYEHVTGVEIWDCVNDKYAKTGFPPVYKIVNDILSLKITQFMNWMTMQAYKGFPLG
jgi:hypothetical protein